MNRRPRRHDEKHLKFIRQLPCVVCLNPIETQAAHVKMSDERLGKRWVGKAEKPDDRWTLPLCGRCHDRQHEGAEKAFWNGAQIDPLMLSLALYGVTGDHEAGEQIIMAWH
jgi:cytochrome c553